MYFEDRIGDDYAKYEAAIKKFRKSKKTRVDEHVCYEELENAGLYPEEADEIINLELENAK